MKLTPVIPFPVVKNKGSWHRVYFEWDDIRDGSLDAMEQEFEVLWSDAGRPAGAALFANRLVNGGRHIYFSPEASLLAEKLLNRYYGLRCDEPSVIRPCLLVGRPEAGAWLLGAKSEHGVPSLLE
jgi:hypothetical protein